MNIDDELRSTKHFTASTSTSLETSCLVGLGQSERYVLSLSRH